MEVASVDVDDAAATLRRKWKVLAGITVAAGIAGAVVASLVPRVWESEANIVVGTAYARPLEDSRVLAKFLESDAFRRSLPARFNSGIRDPVRTQAVELGGGGPMVYIRVVTSARTAEQARDLAQYVVEFVKARHAPIYDAAVSEYAQFQGTLAGVLKDLDAGVSRLHAALNGPLNASRDGGVTSLLLEGQLVSERTQYLMLAEWLRDSKLAQSIKTEPTKEIGPPSQADHPVWPNRLFFVTLSAVLGFAVAAVVLVVRG